MVITVVKKGQFRKVTRVVMSVVKKGSLGLLSEC